MFIFFYQAIFNEEGKFSGLIFEYLCFKIFMEP